MPQAGGKPACGISVSAPCRGECAPPRTQLSRWRNHRHVHRRRSRRVNDNGSVCAAAEQTAQVRCIGLPFHASRTWSPCCISVSSAESNRCSQTPLLGGNALDQTLPLERMTMATQSLTVRLDSPAANSSSKPQAVAPRERRSIWHLLLEAMMESQRRRAEREIRPYLILAGQKPAGHIRRGVERHTLGAQ